MADWVLKRCRVLVFSTVGRAGLINFLTLWAGGVRVGDIR